MSKAPAFQLYAADFYMDTISWSATQVGLYFRLLMYEWVNGPLPDDVNSLARIAGLDPGNFRKCYLQDIAKKFTPHPHGGIVNLRLERTREEQNIWREKSVDGGKRSARLREAKKKGTHTEQEWIALVKMADNVCPRCGNDTINFMKDHVIPIYQGGSDGIDNLQPLCLSCNSQKGPESIDWFSGKRNKYTQPPFQPPFQPLSQPNGNSSSSSSSSTQDKELKAGERPVDNSEPSDEDCPPFFPPTEEPKTAPSEEPKPRNGKTDAYLLELQTLIAQVKMKYPKLAIDSWYGKNIKAPPEKILQVLRSFLKAELKYNNTVVMEKYLQNSIDVEVGKHNAAEFDREQVGKKGPVTRQGMMAMRQIMAGIGR